MTSPHDKLFKATFSRLDEARAALAAVLPDAVSAKIDWGSLALVSGEFIDPELARLSSDLVFTARMGAADACIYVLFEHQSSVDRSMPLRLLRYMTRIWERFAGDRSGQLLPVIIPVVLHHSSAGWKYFQGLGSPAEEAVATMAEQLRAEGRAQGITQGIAQGITQGRAELLCQLLEDRFGALPTDVERRIREASVEQLDVWAKRILRAATLDDVLAS